MSHSEHSEEQIISRLQEHHRSALVVWKNMLNRQPIDDVTWMRLGFTYIQLDEDVMALSAFLISMAINPESNSKNYLKAASHDWILKNSSVAYENSIALFKTHNILQYQNALKKKLDDLLTKRISNEE
jgi:hypothetical protein